MNVTVKHTVNENHVSIYLFRDEHGNILAKGYHRSAIDDRGMYEISLNPKHGTTTADDLKDASEWVAVQLSPIDDLPLLMKQVTTTFGTDSLMERLERGE